MLGTVLVLPALHRKVKDACACLHHPRRHHWCRPAASPRAG